MALAYDEYLGDLSVALSDRAMGRLGGIERRMARALLSAGIVSAHWLLSDDEEALVADGPTLAQVLRIRFAAGDAFDRDALEWIVCVCALVLATVYLPIADQEATVRQIADALGLGEALLDAAHEFWLFSPEASPVSPGGFSPQMTRARDLIVEGCSLQDVALLDPMMLMILVRRFRPFLEDALRS